MREPDVLTPAEFQALLGQLEGAARLMVFLAGATGLRRSELIALRLSDVDFLNAELRITKSCVRGRFGKLKTEASKKPLPLHAAAMRELSSWRAATLYAGDDDFLFPSVRKNGTQPLTPDMLLVKIVRPALKRALVVGKVVGWHTFRHSPATNLRSLGVDVKVAQELLRHANSRVTLNVYTHGVSAEKRAAAMLKRLLADLNLDRYVLQEIVAKVVKPRRRRELAEWAQQVHRMSQRRVASCFRSSA